MENSLEIAFVQNGEIMKTQNEEEQNGKIIKTQNKEEKNRADTGGDLEEKDFAEKDDDHASVKQPFVKREGKNVAEKDGDHASVKQPCAVPFVKNEGKDVAEKDGDHASVKQVPFVKQEGKDVAEKDGDRASVKQIPFVKHEGKDVAETDGDHASVKQPCTVPILKNEGKHEGKDVAEKDADHASVKQPCVVPILKIEGKESAPFRTATVLGERNHDNSANCNAVSKMVSPVLLKLRRNQEKRVTPANPVDPVQVPPKHFQRFPADRYMSPTDSIMSPISRGLLARNRRSNSLPPAIDPSKDLDHKFQNTEVTDHILR